MSVFYKDYSEFVDILHDDDCEILNRSGGGSYATVIEHPDDPTVVVRMGADPANRQYLSLILNGDVNNVAAPVVYCLQPDRSNDNHAAVIERLVHLEDIDCGGLSSLFGSVWDASIFEDHSDKMVCSDGDYPPTETEYDRVRDRVQDLYFLTEYEKELLTDDFLDHQTWCVETGRDLGWNIDIHDHNVMVREYCGVESLVITDPWC